MNVSAEDLRNTARTIWSTQLNLDLENVELAQVTHAFTHAKVVANEIRFSGDFDGRLIQRGSLHLALLAAAAAFATGGVDLGASDARDMLGELVHMTAGNLKSHLPGNCSLSLPEVASELPNPENVILEVGFMLNNEPLLLTLSRF